MGDSAQEKRARTVLAALHAVTWADQEGHDRVYAEAITQAERLVGHVLEPAEILEVLVDSTPPKVAHLQLLSTDQRMALLTAAVRVARAAMPVTLAREQAALRVGRALGIADDLVKRALAG